MATRARVRRETAGTGGAELDAERIWGLMGRLFKTHPWHGVAVGAEAPEIVTIYVEIVPSDAVKYEVDKITGHLKVDRPQKFSNVCPTLYGFIPQTFSDQRVAALARRRTGRRSLAGDGDPLDVCVLSEKAFSHGDFLLRAQPIGGLRMIDGDEADDKIVAVLQGDVAFGEVEDISELPRPVVERLEHYFLTYKLAPSQDDDEKEVEIAGVYGRGEALEVIRRGLDDYRARFPDLKEQILSALRGETGPAAPSARLPASVPRQPAAAKTRSRKPRRRSRAE
jgi:inorganic pyrophosphatase